MARRKQQEISGNGAKPSKRAKSAATGVPGAEAAHAADGNAPARLVVGLGASAGGLDAYSTFFANMPPRSGMVFVLVQHLDPNHKSLLGELLSKYTAMPVVLAEDDMPIAPDHVFVIPPNAVLTIRNGVLHVATPAPPREHRRPIDTFFTSLAEDQEKNAVCIILSGSGSDGSLGLRAVKEHGGFTLAQAGFDETALLGMPSSAAATGLVDEVLPVERMPARLLEYAQHLSAVEERTDSDGTRRDVPEHLARICALLRVRLGHDFSDYKEKTLVRRIQRRMQVLQIDSVTGYMDLLRKDPHQLDLLFRDLLIGVTQFFRDPDAFAALDHQVIRPLLEPGRAGDRIRIWVPGCATGEEAYSIAILVREAMAAREIAPKVEIFATDLDERAIAFARHGRYRKPLSGVSPERLERWFVAEDDDYCVIKNIREMCVFSAHNLVKDPPFSKLDLISCRNLMIYLDTPLQNRLVRTFHYALRPGGYLFLGASEGLARQSGLFTLRDKRHRLFQRRDDVRAALPASVTGPPPAPAHPAAPLPAAPRRDSVELRAMDALEKYRPAHVVINARHEVVHFSGRTGPFIEHPPGAASLNLFSILRKDLQAPVRTAVHKAIAAHRPILQEDLVVPIGGVPRFVALIIEPVPAEAGSELYVVGFQDRGQARPGDAPAGTPAPADARVRALEQELHTLRLQLQSTIDDLEIANEELKSSNEEYQSVNEEYQSANEELESAKEELQSLNEELQTINSELNSKNEALADANSDLKNLFDSTRIATLFLDTDLRIRNFTPAMADVFHLRAGDRGRPITDIVTRVSYGELEQDVRKVLRSLATVEHEVTVAPDGTTFLMRISPYRTVGDVIGGAVLTFVDITERKRHEQERASLAAIVASTQDAVIGHSLDGRITSWNRGAERIFGYTAIEAVGRALATLLPEHQIDEVPPILERLKRGEPVDNFEVGRIDKTGRQIDIAMTISPVHGSGGTISGASTIAHDISDRVRNERLRTLMADELNHRVKNTLATVQAIAAQSLKGIPDGAGREAFDSRLVALSRTHDLLARDHWESASLRALLRQELDPFQSEPNSRATLDGPDVALPPKAALALGMAFHELATNAAKHGALSAPNGHVGVTWTIHHSSGPVLRLEWVESGGPPVRDTGHKGFGSILLGRGLALELSGEVRLDLRPEGLVCTVEAPLLPAAGRGSS